MPNENKRITAEQASQLANEEQLKGICKQIVDKVDKQISIIASQHGHQLDFPIGDKVSDDEMKEIKESFVSRGFRVLVSRPSSPGVKFYIRIVW